MIWAGPVALWMGVGRGRGVVKVFKVFIYVCFLKNHYICHA